MDADFHRNIVANIPLIVTKEKQILMQWYLFIWKQTKNFNVRLNKKGKYSSHNNNYFISCTNIFFFRSIFFPFKFFLQQHKIIINSNNMKNNYMNQLLPLLFLKYTHTKYIYIHIIKKTKRKKKRKKIIIIKRRQYHPPSLRKKKDSYSTPDEGSHGNSQGIGAVNCCRKDLHPRGRTCPRFSSFLCKCNLTKS